MRRSEPEAPPASPAASLRTLRLADATETALWLAATAGGAAWAAHVGTLPGGHRGAGAAVQGAVWACLFVGLGLTYGTPAMPDRGARQRVVRTVGIVLALALLSTQGCRLWLQARLGPAVWGELFYARWLVPLALVGLWGAVLLPRGTRAPSEAAFARREGAPRRHLAVLIVAAAVLVSCADLAFAFQRGGGAVQARLTTDEIRVGAWILNVIVLFSAYLLVFAVTRRVAAALLAVSPAYLGLGFATLAKIKYMHSAVQPLDLLKVPEFLPLVSGFFGAWAVPVAAIGCAGWLAALLAAARRPPCRLSGRGRCAMGAVALVGLVACPALVRLSHSSPVLSRALYRLGMPTGQQREQARRHGFLLSFLAELPSVLVDPPSGYSASAVASALSRYRSSDETGRGQSPRRVSVIIYLVESLMDPDDLGIRYTADPVPNLRALRRLHTSGYAIVPDRFGGSANTEFEVLTGMVTAFLPEGSVPYRQYLRRPVPSLPSVLKRWGYSTTAIQADHRYYYDRERVYGLLDFDRVVWLRELPGVRRAGRGDWPSDESVVEEIIRASRGPGPFFIFAFPSSTHGPYHTGVHAGSSLNVRDRMEPEAVREVQEYINTLRVADEALGALIRHFSRHQDSTAILVIGDHLPPLSASAFRPFFRRLAGRSEVERSRLTRRVPFLLWTNFGAPRKVEEVGTSMIPALLYETLGVVPGGFPALTMAARRELPNLGEYVRSADDGVGNGGSVSLTAQAMVHDYRLVQYDLLLGRQYALEKGQSARDLLTARPAGSTASRTGAAIRVPCCRP